MHILVFILAPSQSSKHLHNVLAMKVSVASFNILFLTVVSKFLGIF